MTIQTDQSYSSCFIRTVWVWFPQFDWQPCNISKLPDNCHQTVIQMNPDWCVEVHFSNLPTPANSKLMRRAQTGMCQWNEPLVTLESSVQPNSCSEWWGPSSLIVRGWLWEKFYRAFHEGSIIDWLAGCHDFFWSNSLMWWHLLLRKEVSLHWTTCQFQWSEEFSFEKFVNWYNGFKPTSFWSPTFVHLWL